MSMLRIAKCDVCSTSETEKSYGVGWEDWCIIQGIAAVAPDKRTPTTTENTSMILCPLHKDLLVKYVDSMQKGA